MYSELERHSLVWLTAAGWEAVITSARSEHAAALAQWQRNDWPAVVRRFDAIPKDADAADAADATDAANAENAENAENAANATDAAASDICLGVPLPPDAAGLKVRIALRVAPSHVARASAALELRSALMAAGPWHDGLAELSDAAPTMRVFGSLAMQTLTGLQYLSPSSDVDLLFHPDSRRQLDTVISLLARHSEHLPLDGEVVFPGGAAVSWKEWQAATTHPAKVLVKELRAVRLADTASLLAALEAA